MARGGTLAYTFGRAALSATSSIRRQYFPEIVARTGALSQCPEHGETMRGMEYAIAKHSDFDAIHRLNYRTFVDEIPQHAPNASLRLIDRFHDENTYFVCRADKRIVGMVCGRQARPFSLDQKIPDLDRWLPAHREMVEVRLLSVERAFRKTAVFLGLIECLSRHYIPLGCDLVVISGTVRELKLYRHLGFAPFAEPVGPSDASYQPMYLTLDAFARQAQRRRGRRLLP
jgi:hypothetical protein